MGAVDDKEKQAGQAYTRLENSILGHGRIGLPVLGRFLFLGAYPRPIILFVLLFTVPCFAKEVCPNFDKLVQEYHAEANTVLRSESTERILEDFTKATPEEKRITAVRLWMTLEKEQKNGNLAKAKLKTYVIILGEHDPAFVYNAAFFEEQTGIRVLKKNPQQGSASHPVGGPARNVSVYPGGNALAQPDHSAEISHLEMELSRLNMDLIRAQHDYNNAVIRGTGEITASMRVTMIEQKISDIQGRLLQLQE